MSRDITLEADFEELVGDETYELWLKHAGSWGLYGTGAVTTNPQDFVLSTLTEGDDYVAQFRLKRSGRYRVGWLTADPDTWPASSRFAFTPGALAGVGAPTINSGSWQRTDATHQEVDLQINASSLTTDLAIFRNGTLLTTLSQPFTNPVTYIDHDPPIGVLHTYTAKHVAGGSYSPASNAEHVFAGPLPPSSFDQESSTSHFGSYTVEWDSGGNPVEIQDDFNCILTFGADLFSGSAADFQRDIEMDLIPTTDTMVANLHARIRRTVTTFGTPDVSDWVAIPITCVIYAANPDYNQHC